MNPADVTEYRNDHVRDASSMWAHGKLLRATDQALIVALLREVLGASCR